MEKEKLLNYGNLFFGLLGVFLLGAYTDATINCSKEVTWAQWCLTTIIALLFIGEFLTNLHDTPDA